MTPNQCFMCRQMMQKGYGLEIVRVQHHTTFMRDLYRLKPDPKSFRMCRGCLEKFKEIDLESVK